MEKGKEDKQEFWSTKKAIIKPLRIKFHITDLRRKKILLNLHKHVQVVERQGEHKN
jgi:hypothetical protein